MQRPQAPRKASGVLSNVGGDGCGSFHGLRLNVADPHKVGDDKRPRIRSARDIFMQEPSLAISSQEAGLDEALRAFPEDEVARLEKLLAARARETNVLTREL